MSSRQQPFEWQSLAYDVVIGVDEVGRGCLAGPVCAGAVVLRAGGVVAGINDSKTMSEIRRSQVAEAIRRDHAVGVAFASVEEITQLNIRRAALLAMRRAVELLEEIWVGRTTVILVDGRDVIPGLPAAIEQIPIIKGDARALPIGAASIVAKVTRDEWIAHEAEGYPQYGFAKHKGYGTPEHLAAIRKWGPCPLHRPTFAGVREFVGEARP